MKYRILELSVLRVLGIVLSVFAVLGGVLTYWSSAPPYQRETVYDCNGQMRNATEIAIQRN